MDEAKARRVLEGGVWRGRHLMQTPLVPGRECDACVVCCVALNIDDPELTKAHGVRCSHLSPEGGCGVYADRPLTCRHFNCGWRMMKWVHPDLRPDRSGVLVRLQMPKTGTQGEELHVVVSLDSPKAIEAPGFAETVAAAVMAGRPIHLEAAAKPGAPVGVVQLNDGLLEPVIAQDRAEMLHRLRLAYREAQAFQRKPGKPGKRR